MTAKTGNALEQANTPPAKAGTPNHLASLGKLEAEIQEGIRFGVSPSGGEARAKTVTAKTGNALEQANTPPAKAGTPNHLASLGKLEAKIQEGMRLGVPPSGGWARAKTMTAKPCNALEMTNIPSLARPGTISWHQPPWLARSVI